MVLDGFEVFQNRVDCSHPGCLAAHTEIHFFLGLPLVNSGTASKMRLLWVARGHRTSDLLFVCLKIQIKQPTSSYLPWKQL